MYPYKGNRDQQLQADAESVAVGRGFVAQVNYSEAAAQSATAVLAATALTAEAQTIIVGITNPDVVRSVKVKGNAAGIAGNVVITGTNVDDKEITETIALNGSTEVLGDKAFKTITSIALPVQTNAGTDTVSVGTANKLGLPYLLSKNTVLFAFRNSTKEGTAPTVSTSATEFENNTVLLNSALNGTDIDVYLVV